jgi:predicted AAA+ superfamily ATPase
MNHAEFSRTLGLPQTTLKRYFALLEAVSLVHRVPAWSANLGKRLVRTSKLYLLDAGLACHLQGLTAESWEDANTRRGPLLENFVFSELVKQLGWARTRAKLHHFRSHGGDEVDFLLEDARGRVASRAMCTRCRCQRYGQPILGRD